MKHSSLYILLFMACWGTSCTPKYIKQYKKEMVKAPSSQSEKDQNIILGYLSDNKLDFQKTDSGIYYSISREGEGGSPSESSIVEAHYKGYTMDGKVFDSSYDRNEPLVFPLGNVIKGWQESIPMLKPGGKGTFIIPSGLAYGKQGAGADIPPNTVLVFDVELLDHYTEEEKEARRKAKQRKKMEAYAAESGLDMKTTDSGIMYLIETPGTGKHPTVESTVKIHYKGMLLDGTVFDSSYDRGEPAVFGLGRLIPGWQEAIPMLREGGRGTFAIPSELAYGTRGAGGVIPPDAPLVFEVELFNVMTAEDLRKEREAAMSKQKTTDDAIIQQYIKDNGLNARKAEKGLYYVVDNPGAAPNPTIDNTVTLHYRGALVNGKVFDSSYERGQPASFPLRNLIEGWQIGIPKFGKGGKGKLLIPSHIGYGPMGSGRDIPPNSVLVFDIEVIDFK